MGLRPAARPTRPARTRSTPPTPTSRSRSASTRGTTTGASSPTASSPATHPTSSPTTCRSSASSSTRTSWSPLDPTLTKDGFNTNQYQPGLADLWKGQDGKRYGLPKDFDTIALFYNKKLRPGRRLGVRPAEPDLEPDGRRHVREGRSPTSRMDTNGRRGDEPGFDKTQGQGLRARPGRRLRRRQRADPVEHVHRLRRLAVHRQEPLGHPLQLRPAEVPGDHQLVQDADRQGLHAQRGRGDRAGPVAPSSARASTR